jgi:hypothetical protein
LLTVSKSFMNLANSVFWRMAIILKFNKVNLFVSSVLFCFSRTIHRSFQTHHVYVIVVSQLVRVKAAALTCQAGNEELEITDQPILNLGPRRFGRSMPSRVRFYPGKKKQFPIVQETERVSGPFCMAPENLAHTVVWTLDPPAHINSIYELR